MKPAHKVHLKTRLNTIAPEGRDPAIHTVIDVVEAIIDSLPDERQPKLKPKGRGNAGN